jgi:hypothetical protein
MMLLPELMKELTSIAQHSVSQIEDLSEKYIQTALQMSQFHFFFLQHLGAAGVPFYASSKEGSNEV